VIRSFLPRRAFDDAGGLYRIAEVVLDCGDVLELLHLLWSAGCRYDAMTAIDQFLENDAACLTCGSIENDFQRDCSLDETGVVFDAEQQTYPQPTMPQELPMFRADARQNKKSREVTINAVDVAIDHAQRASF